MFRPKDPLPLSTSRLHLPLTQGHQLQRVSEGPEAPCHVLRAHLSFLVHWLPPRWAPHSSSHHHLPCFPLSTSNLTRPLMWMGGGGIVPLI